MSLKDSVFTNPESLRLLYTNPRNSLRALDELGDQSGQSQGGQILIGGINTGETGGTTGSPRNTCPAVGQYVYARGHEGRIVAVKCEQIFTDDWIWNPTTDEFEEVESTEIIEDQECYEVATVNGCSQIVTLTHPVIQRKTDKTGMLVQAIIARPRSVIPALTVVNDIVRQNEIDSVKEAGRRAVVRISLKTGFIYAIGVDPKRMMVGHNKEQQPTENQPI